MSDSLVPVSSQPASPHLPPDGVLGTTEYVAPAQARNPLERPLAALRRYKWVIICSAIASFVLGIVGWRFAKPEYNARATLWVASETPSRLDNGPIRAGELLNQLSWVELFRSFRIVDDVVRKLNLYLEPDEAADQPLFATFSTTERFAAGKYELVIDRAAKTWVLIWKKPRFFRTPLPVEVERGASGDSVGRAVGFLWTLPDSAFLGEGQREVAFSVVTPRETSVELLGELTPHMRPGSNFLWLELTSNDAKIAATTLNTWVREFMQVSAELKKRNLTEFAKILKDQLDYAERATLAAESAYQNFRVNAITLPTDEVPVAAGAAGGMSAGDPAIASFFNQKIEYDNLRQDREALERSLASASTTGGARYEGLLLIPSVAQSPGAEALRAAFANQYQLQAQLTVLRQTYTDEFPAVKALVDNLKVVQTQTIPQLAEQLLGQLKEREVEYQRRIASASRELQQIPPRTIEERRLARSVGVSEGLYTNLRARFAEAQLAEASAIPDIALLDTAVAAGRPLINTGPKIFLVILAGGLAAAMALAILLDLTDRRFRYSDQVMSDLGLPIAGAVPLIPKGGITASPPEQVVQIVESFRSLRMHVMHGTPSRRLVLAVTSAAPSDGKSLVSANLALSCSDAGLRTLLVDGDTRRGSLHRTFGMTIGDGLTDCLVKGIAVQSVIRSTNHDDLSFLSCGHRHPRSPELLASRELQRLVHQLSELFDVVIFDTPPLAAGIDGYAISAAAGNILMVIRMGQTERRLAAAKLSLLDRLPVEVVGAVMNGVPLSGEFQYYAYATGYSVDRAEPADLVTSGAR